MSSENVTRLIEKQRERSSLQRLWHNEENLTRVSQENRIYENIFTTSPASGINNVDIVMAESSKNSSVSGINHLDNYMKESYKNKTDLKLNPEMIKENKTKIAKEDFKMFGKEDTENPDSDQIYLHKLHHEIKDIENVNSEIKQSKMVNTLDPLQESVGQNSCKHTEGKFLSINVLSNKGTMHGALEPQKRSDTHRSNVHDGISIHRDSSTVSTGTAGDVSELNQDNVQTENTEKAHVNSNITTEENEDDMKSSETVEEVMEIDEVDYYDSEDEYWSTHDVDDYQYDYVNDTHTSTASTLTSGRYSHGVEQVRNLPVFERSIRKFAFDNNFEVHDVIPDGNCMFRALSDQLMINGFPGHTEASLRKDAITYLRSKPFKEDGGHDSSFLSGETWEEYLNRMERSREWGDHTVLQALVDVYNLQVIVFNVFQEDIRKTEVLVESDEHNEERLTIFLGHLGEFHYLSLRLEKWFEQWPYKAVLCRLLVCSTDVSCEDFEAVLRKKISKMGTSECLSNSELEKVSKFTLQNKGRFQTSCGDSAKPLFTRKCLFMSFSGEDLQLQDTKDSLACVIEDPLHTDPVSGIPLPHLSILLRHLMPEYSIIHTSYQCCSISTVSHYTGSAVDGTKFIRLKDISRLQKMNDFYGRRVLQNRVAYLKCDLEAVLLENVDMHFSSTVIYIDASKTNPGYCRLVFPEDHVPESGQITLRTESGLYLGGFNTPDLPHASDGEMTTVGIRCAFDTVANEWCFRERNFDFPSPALRLVIYTMYCTLIPKAHHKSDNPAIEWKIDFSMIESVLVKSLSSSQRHGFDIFKILLDNLTFHLKRRLKTNHLKSVFFKACEEFPSILWKSNLGGCILFVVSKLLTYLKGKFFPHYFIPLRNLIDHFQADEIDTLCVIVESIRAYPVHVSQFVAQKHGIVYGENLVRSILADTVRFAKTRDVVQFTKWVIPETYQTAKFLARLGSYESTLGLLDSVHELSKFLCEHQIPSSFYEFVNSALQEMKQRASRIILARMYDNRFGTNMAGSFIKDSKQSLEKKLSWKTDFRINWLEVPKNKSGDLVSIADFLYKQSLDEYHKRNATLASLLIETAIQCIKKSVQEDSIDVKNIEDMELKHEILEQKRAVQAKLKQYLVHAFYVSALYLKLYPLLDYIMDIENICKEFPEMTSVASVMFMYLKLPDKSKEYAEKMQLDSPLSVAGIHDNFYIPKSPRRH